MRGLLQVVEEGGPEGGEERGVRAVPEEERELHGHRARALDRCCCCCCRRPYAACGKRSGRERLAREGMMRKPGGSSGEDERELYIYIVTMDKVSSFSLFLFFVHSRPAPLVRCACIWPGQVLRWGIIKFPYYGLLSKGRAFVWQECKITCDCEASSLPACTTNLKPQAPAPCTFRHHSQNTMLHIYSKTNSSSTGYPTPYPFFTRSQALFRSPADSVSLSAKRTACTCTPHFHAFSLLSAALSRARAPAGGPQVS